MTRKWLSAIGGLLFLLPLLACSNMKYAPQVISADGDTYLACHGFLTIDGNRQDGFSVSFTDALGHSQDVRGIRQLEITNADAAKLCRDAIAEAQAQQVLEKREQECYARSNDWTWDGTNCTTAKFAPTQPYESVPASSTPVAKVHPKPRKRQPQNDPLKYLCQQPDIHCEGRS